MEKAFSIDGVDGSCSRRRMRHYQDVVVLSRGAIHVRACYSIDLAKSVFQIHGVDERGQVLVRRQLRRSHPLASAQLTILPLSRASS